MGCKVFDDHRNGKIRDLKILHMKNEIGNDLIGICVASLVVFFIVNLFSVGIALSSLGWFWLIAAIVTIVYSIIISFTVMLMYAASFLDDVPKEE